MYLLLFFSRWFRCLTFSFSLFFFQFFSLFKLALFVFAELDVCLCVGPSFTRSLCACISIHICVELVGRNEAKTNNNCTNKMYNNTHGFFYRALTRDKQNESHDTNVKSQLMKLKEQTNDKKKSILCREIHADSVVTDRKRANERVCFVCDCIVV